MAQKGAKKPRLAEEEESAAAIEVDSDSEDDGGDDGSQEEESGLQEEESGKPGTKRTRGKGTPGTRDPEVVKNWGTSMLKKVICHYCGTFLKAKKSGVQRHIKDGSADCKSNRVKVDHAQAEADSKLGSSSATLPELLPVQWPGKSKMAVQFFKPERALDRDEAEAKRVDMTHALCLSMVSEGIPPAVVGRLFSSGASVLSGLMFLGPQGLGSDKSVAHSASAALDAIWEAKIKPHVRDAVDNKVPICVLIDESPTSNVKGKGVIIAHVYTALMASTGPATFELDYFNRTPTGEQIADKVRDMFTAKAMSAREFAQHVLILKGDHAANVQKAAKVLGVTFSGDAAHGMDLVCKVIIHSSGMKPFVMALRKILHCKSYVVKRALEAFDVSPAVANMPTTRWGYWAKLCSFMATPDQVVRLQQALIFLYKEYAKGPVVSLPGVAWMDGLAYGPAVGGAGGEGGDDSGDEDDDEDAIADIDADVGDDWGDKLDFQPPGWEVADFDNEAPQGGGAAANATGEDDSDQDDEDVSKQVKLYQQVLKAVCDPALLTVFALLAQVLRPLRTAQVEMEGSSTMGTGQVQSLKSAYSTLSGYLLSEQSFQTVTKPCNFYLKAATANAAVTHAKQAPGVVVERAADGTYTVTGLPAAGSGNEKEVRAALQFTVQYDKASAEEEWTKALNFFRQPITAAYKKYDQYGVVAYEVAYRRLYASLKLDFGVKSTEQAFMTLIRERNALPPAPDASGRPVQLKGAGRDTAAATAENEFATYLTCAQEVDHVCHIKSADRRDPGRYWLRVRAALPMLARVMLWWLSDPTGTAGIERDFSLMTIVNNNSRLRRLGEAGFRVRVLARCYRARTEERLAELTKTGK